MSFIVITVSLPITSSIYRWDELVALLLLIVSVAFFIWIRHLVLICTSSPCCLQYDIILISELLFLADQGTARPLIVILC